MAKVVFTHEFALRYEVAATATSPPMVYTTFGRNPTIDLTETEAYREEHILWTDDKRFTCFSTLKLNRQIAVGDRPAGLLCSFSVNLIEDDLRGFPRPETVGVAYVSDHIAWRFLAGSPIHVEMQDSTRFFMGLTESRAFFLGSSQRLHSAHRGVHGSDRSAQSIQYFGTIRPSDSE